MRVAALYDIHGNLPALEAVLGDVRAARIDRLVIGGDVFPGPMSREALARLRSLDIPTAFIRGNCETAVLAERAGRGAAIQAGVRETIRWTARQLMAEEAAFVEEWPPTRTLAIGGTTVLFCHATPRDDNEIFTAATAEARVAPAFTGVAAPLVVCGHTHIQFERDIGTVHVVNAGSVGMPFEGPGAFWLLLGPGIELRRTDYDLAAAAERIRSTAYPQAEEFAARYVLEPPSARETLELFARAEMR